MRSIDNEVEKKLKSEIALLNPEVRSQRLKPLEGQVTQLQQKVKSLNVDYKLNVMNDLEKEANELGDKADENKDDMTKVDSEIKKTTMEMKKIADGLKSRMNNQEIEVNLFCDNYLSQWWLEFDLTGLLSNNVFPHIVSAETILWKL